MKEIFLLLTLIAAARCAIRTPTEHFAHSLVLDKDGNFELFWNNNSTHVIFEVHVKTHGYVGFGFSPNGNMFPSDVVVGWVKNGKTFFKDYHTEGHFAPVLDQSQDWFLLHGAENELGTVLKFVRKIDTCDPDDIVINDATQRLIYSYHPDDPTDENQLGYHGTERRGTKSVSLLSQTKIPDVFSVGDTKIVDLRANNYIIPDKETTYLCVAFQMPDLGQKHHMVEFEPIYTPGNEAMLHHSVILRCDGSYPELSGAMGECYLSWPKGWPFCVEVFAAWATGGGPYYFPANAGYSVGAPNDKTFYILQNHYDNPAHKSGVIDSSGLRLRLTTTLRQHDVGTLTMGHKVTPFQIVPPKQSSFITKGYCDGDLLAKDFVNHGVDEITVIAGLQHAHLLGYGMVTRHIRNGTELPPIQDDPNYDFYFQELRSLAQPATVKKGDGFIVECNYSTMARSEVAFGGLTTREEMCLSFLYYYPNIGIVSCDSYPDMQAYFNTSLNHFDPGFTTLVKNAIDWNDKAAIEQFKQDLETMPVVHRISGQNVFGNSTVREKRIFAEHHDFKPYVPPKTSCTSH